MWSIVRVVVDSEGGGEVFTSDFEVFEDIGVLGRLVEFGMVDEFCLVGFLGW